MAGVPGPLRRIALAALIGLLAAGLAGPPAGAAHHTAVAEKAVPSSIAETVVLPVNNYTVYSFSLLIGETITYDVRVTNGSAVDLYFLPPGGLDVYESDSPDQFLVYAQIENRTAFSGTFGNASGDVAVVIDNVALTQGGANPSGSVTLAVALHKNASIVYLGAAALVGFGVALLVGVAIVARRRAKRPAEPEAPPPLRPYEKRPGAPGTEEPPKPEEPPPGP